MKNTTAPERKKELHQRLMGRDNGSEADESIDSRKMEGAGETNGISKLRRKSWARDRKRKA